MILRGKDFCDCAHARMLRAALVSVREALNTPHGLVAARARVNAALTADADACLDLWGPGDTTPDTTTTERTTS